MGREDGYEKEARKLEKTRYKAGCCGQMTAPFILQTIISKMKPAAGAGARLLSFSTVPP